MKLLLNWMKGKSESPAETNGSFGVRPGSFMFIFFLSSFVLWMQLFSIYRYIIVAELLVPICIAIVMERVISSGRARLALGAALAISVLVTYSPLNWGRANWSNPYLLVDTSRLSPSSKSVVVILGSSPIAYAIPFFPPGMRFIRPEGNLNLTDQTLFMQEIKGLLKKTRGGDFFVLYDRGENIDPSEGISKLGIDAKMQECFSLSSNIPDQLEICRFSYP